MSVARLVRGIAGRLQQLQQLELGFVDEVDDDDDKVYADDPVAAWPEVVLPALVNLHIFDLAPEMFQGTADAISRLSALTGLSLDAVILGWQDEAAIDALARAIGGLPRLQALDSSNVVLGRSHVAAELLSAATGLTSLQLRAAGLDNWSFSQLFASGMTGLRSLDIMGDCYICVSSALLVAGCLPHLTELVLHCGSYGGSSEADARCWRRIASVLQQRRQAAGQ